MIKLVHMKNSAIKCFTLNGVLYINDCYIDNNTVNKKSCKNLATKEATK